MKTTIKKYIAVLFLATTGASSLQQIGMRPVSVEIKGSSIDISTSKIARMYDHIDEKSYMQFRSDVMSTKNVSGDRVVLINSGGGDAAYGKLIISMLNAEKLANSKRIICVSEGNSHSMAFNILSTCDVRLSVSKSAFLVHKLHYTSSARMCQENSPLTSKILNLMAADLAALDEPYRQGNAKAMNISIEDYDIYSDNETMFLPDILLKMKYLHGIVTIKKSY